MQGGIIFYQPMYTHETHAFPSVHAVVQIIPVGGNTKVSLHIRQSAYI